MYSLGFDWKELSNPRISSGFHISCRDSSVLFLKDIHLAVTMLEVFFQLFSGGGGGGGGGGGEVLA